MPSFAQHQSTPLVKMLYIGPPGGGKTGSIAALANAGYNLRVIDFDNGLDIFHDFLRADALERVHYETLTDKMVTEESTPGDIITRPQGKPTAFSDAMKLLDRWKVPAKKGKYSDGTSFDYPAYDLGSVSSWGDNDILVIDGLTMLSYYAMYYCLALNDAKGSRWVDWYPQDYKHAQRRVEMFLEIIKSKQIRCNVIVTAHIRYLGGGGIQVQENKTTNTESRREMDSRAEGKGFAFCLGRQLPYMVGSYFNSLLMAEQSAGRIQITTKSEGQLDLKNPCPTHIPARLFAKGGDPKGGLVEFFNLIRKHGTQQKETTSHG